VLSHDKLSVVVTVLWPLALDELGETAEPETATTDRFLEREAIVCIVDAPSGSGRSGPSGPSSKTSSAQRQSKVGAASASVARGLDHHKADCSSSDTSRSQDGDGMAATPNEKGKKGEKDKKYQTTNALILDSGPGSIAQLLRSAAQEPDYLSLRSAGLVSEEVTVHKPSLVLAFAAMQCGALQVYDT
jgi:hypothetical protein